MKIAFWDNSLCERGTSIALYDYAYFNIHILKNESIIMYNTTRENDLHVIDKFKSQFTVYGVSSFKDADSILETEKCDVLYVIKGGENEGQISKICKTVVHCVFNVKQPHGDVYAAISNWVSLNKVPVVPHIVYLPETTDSMRQKLGVPSDAIVFGRYGGYNQFDIRYVQSIVYQVAKQYPNIYFLFMNTRQFCPPLFNIIHVSKEIDLIKKREFINTCDAMLWARSEGESFGLSIAEFSYCNKPVLVTTNDKMDNAHVELLGDKGIWYNENSLEYILSTFHGTENKDWNAYRDYSPEKVMTIFKNIFLS